MTAPRTDTTAAAVLAGAATLNLPPFPVGIDAQDLVTIIRRQMLIAEYIAEVTGGQPSSEARALRWVLATISDHAARTAAETGNSLYRWTATQLHHAAKLPDDLAAAEVERDADCFECGTRHPATRQCWEC
jgi:hypothetical protein